MLEGFRRFAHIRNTFFCVICDGESWYMRYVSFWEGGKLRSPKNFKEFLFDFWTGAVKTISRLSSLNTFAGHFKILI